VHYSTSDINRDILPRMGIPLTRLGGFGGWDEIK
jgi:hypothetical protein